MPDFDLIRRFGITVYLLPDLPEPILYLREQHMALVDADLTDEARETAADWLLASIAGRADA